MRWGFLLPLMFFFVIALLVGVYAGAGLLLDQTKQQTKDVYIKKTGEQPPQLSAEAFFAGYVDKTGQVKELASANADMILPVASITKLLSVPVVQEQLGDDSVVNISERAASIPNSNHPTLHEGQKFLARDLYAVSLVESNNDAVTALAEAVNEETVLTRMREYAGRIGMEGSSWMNVTGLDPIDAKTEPNSASVRGLARLGAWMVKEKPQLLAFTREKVIPLVDANGSFVRNATTTDMLLAQTDLPYAIIGGKTGETARSGGNLLVLWRGPNNIVLITVVLNAKDRFAETRSLVEYLARAYTVRND